MGNISRRDGLDDELAEAAGLDAASDANDGTMAVPAPASATAVAPSVAGAATGKRGSWGLLLTLLVMAAGLVALFMFGFQDAAVYSVPVDKLLADQASVGKRVRIEGELVPGTLTRRDKPCEYRFKLRGEGKDLEIRYPQCVIPDTFRDVPGGGVQVTVEGSLSPEGHFQATQVFAKCTSKYDPKSHAMQPEGAATAAPSMPIN
jgi:cytochrome c-type biogenesis protein CcmE